MEGTSHRNAYSSLLLALVCLLYSQVNIPNSRGDLCLWGPPSLPGSLSLRDCKSQILGGPILCPACQEVCRSLFILPTPDTQEVFITCPRMSHPNKTGGSTGMRCPSLLPAHSLFSSILQDTRLHPAPLPTQRPMPMPGHWELPVFSTSEEGSYSSVLLPAEPPDWVHKVFPPNSRGALHCLSQSLRVCHSPTLQLCGAAQHCHTHVLMVV